MKKMLELLFSYQKLSHQEAFDVMMAIGAGKYSDSEIAAFLTVFSMRPVSVEELHGFRKALLELCIRIDFSDFDTIDVCGTGGDGKNTFNISTLTAFVLAGVGYKVTKHGNYGATSVSGSSNVLEFLGYRFTNNSDVLRSQLDKYNFCMMHAPLFHPAMKYVGGVRKALGTKTFFNMLGPLVNPGFPDRQVVGVYSLEVARIYSYLFQNTRSKYIILHSLDGYDEISLTQKFKCVMPSFEETIAPEDLGFRRLELAQISGGSRIEDAADIFLKVLKNEATPAQKDVVIANAAFGIRCYEPFKSYEDCIAVARESLESGAAYRCFQGIIQSN
ncbi:MAG TPA: anthranilate phosphoribosyltransferase [Saprospiraceae bacterium]|nr:anthranilate phosphoribosyltransferase [Saprospiraceae bacterium]